jgi:general secretion pathway protein K
MRSRREDGFVLIAAIWVVALLSLVVVIIGGWMTRSLGRAGELQQRVTDRAATLGAIDQVSYLMATNYFTGRGLEKLSGRWLTLAGSSAFAVLTVPEDSPFVALDGRPYRLGNSLVRLQDNRGLYNLNYADSGTLGDLLRGYNVPYTERSGLVDKLLDYTGAGILQHLNGATTDQYRAAGLPDPRNAPLITPWEIRRVLGWDDYASALFNGATSLTEVTTVSDSVGINPNTATPMVLRSLPGMDDRALARVLEYRQHYLIQNETDFTQAAGKSSVAVPLLVFYFPASSLRLKIATAGDPLEHIVSLRLTHNGVSPVRVDYEVDLPAPASQKWNAARADEAPAFPAVFPAIASNP